jgi:hypothetical protein
MYSRFWTLTCNQYLTLCILIYMGFMCSNVTPHLPKSWPFHTQHNFLQNVFTSPLLPIYAKGLVVAYVVLPSPSSSLATSPWHSVGVFKSINHETLDFASSIGLDDWGN